MRISGRAFLAALCVVAVGGVDAAAAQPAPAATVKPGVSIEAASWLAGRWVGEGLGGQVEEMWSPPQNGQMVGHFSLVVNGKLMFYEMLLIDVTADGLRMRVKHFNRDFTAWEDKGGWHSFEPVSATSGDLRFKGLSLHLEGQTMVATIQLRSSEGVVEDKILRLERAPL